MKIFPKLKNRKKYIPQIPVFSPESLFSLSFTSYSHLKAINRPEEKKYYEYLEKQVYCKNVDIKDFSFDMLGTAKYYDSNEEAAYSQNINIKTHVLSDNIEFVTSDLAKMDTPRLEDNYAVLKKTLEKEFFKRENTCLIELFNPINLYTRKYEKHDIVLGIDFGTSSCKIVVQDSTVNNEPVVIYPEHSSAGFPAFAFPMLLSVKEGKLYFGKFVEGSEFNYSSLKICFMCTDPKCKDCKFSEQFIQEDKILKCHADIDIKEITVLFMSYLIRYTKNYIKETLVEKGIIPKYFYHMGAPVDTIDSREKISFEESLFLAKKLAFYRQVDNGAPLNQLDMLYQRVKEKDPALPAGKEQRDFFVLPEAYAGLISYFNSPMSRQGLYAIVDIGAFTTDMSCFWYDEANLVACFYYTETNELGCIDIDLLTISSLNKNEVAKDMLFKARKAREKIYSKNITETKIRSSFFSETDIQSNAKAIGEKIRKLFLSLLGNARKKDDLESTWRELNLFIVGGGSRMKDIVEILNRTFEPGIVLYGVKINHIRSYNPFKKKVEDNDLLWVASGLSIHKVRWQELVMPTALESIKTRPYKMFDCYERSRQYD